MIQKRKKQVLWLYLTSCFIAMFSWSYITPYLDEDWDLDNLSLHQILQAGIADYFHWNGRFFGQSFSRLITAHGVLVSSIWTAFFFTCMVFLLLKLTRTYNKDRIYWYRTLVIIGAIVMFTPGFAEVFLWRAGVGNYLMPMVFQLMFLYLFTNGEGIRSCFLTCILGFIAGWGNENTSGAIILFALLFMGLNFYRHGRLSKTRIVELLAVVIGYLFLILSPGDHKRMMSSDSAWLKENFIKRTVKSFLDINSFIYDHQFMLIFVTIVALVLVTSFFFWKDQVDYSQAVIYIVSGIASVYVLALSPEGQNEYRTYLGGFIFLLIGLFLMIPQEMPSYLQRWLWVSLTTIMFVLGFFFVSNGVRQSLAFNSALKERFASIVDQREHNAKTAKVKPIQTVDPTNSYSIGSIYFELNPDNLSSAFPNTAYDKNFNITVKLVK